MSDIMELSLDFERILLKPLDYKFKYTFRGWKSLALLHSWDDIVYKDADRVFEFKDFNKKYKYYQQNESKLMQRLKALYVENDEYENSQSSQGSISSSSATDDDSSYFIIYCIS